MQTTAEKNDRDEHYYAAKVNKLAMGLEAKTASNKFWQAIFGIEAPFHRSAKKTPEDYDEDGERYNELLIEKWKSWLL